MNNFSLTYNPLLSFPSQGQLLNHVRINRFISQYYQPFPGCYLLKSAETAFDLSESFKGFFENTAFMLIQYASGLASGQLPQEIWNWINFGEVPVPPPPAVPAPPGYQSLIDLAKRYPPIPNK